MTCVRYVIFNSPVKKVILIILIVCAVINVQVGNADEIIPLNSIDIIERALNNAGNTKYKTILLENASQPMRYTGKSDFPYMPKLYPEYLKIVEDLLNSVSNIK